MPRSRAGPTCLRALIRRNSIGVQNVLAIERLLKDLGIPIIGRHCGGEQGRRMKLDASTGIVTIDIVGVETTTL